MKIKKILCFALVACMLPCIVVPLTACEPKKMYSEPEKIADYLYAINYTDYRKDVDWNTINAVEAFGCSSVRNGNFYGRNFDYIYNDTPEFIVQVSATPTRHASIGVATHFGLREDKIDTYDKQLELIPNFTLDGINDCGVICSHNVVKIEDDNKNMLGTNPNGEDLHMLFIPRFVLDNASSADDAIKLIKSRNIIGNLHDQSYLHIMIADANKTYVVEFYKGGVLVEEKTGDKQIMTNYYLNLPEINAHPLGLERYKILQQNYAEATSVEGMQKLMKRVQYSHAYDLPINLENFWLSEFFTYDQVKMINNKEDGYLDFVAQVKPVAEELFEAYKTKTRVSANPAFWHTVHNSTYDMANKKLYVFVQEIYDKDACYEFSLQPQQNNRNNFFNR